MRTQAINLAVLAGVTSANSVPIFGTYPGWVQGGGKANVEVEIFFDYLCADSKANYPIVEAMLNEEIAPGLSVFDGITLKLSSFPLDYHIHSWQVAQILPYLLDLCSEGTSCKMNDYLDLGFAQQDQVLSMSGYSKDSFIPYWSKVVADSLDLDYETILGLYDRDNDVHNTEMGTRMIWKYGAAKGVSGTPTAFVNGVMLDSFPASATEWNDLLSGVYQSQWHPTTPTQFLN